MAGKLPSDITRSKERWTVEQEDHILDQKVPLAQMVSLALACRISLASRLCRDPQLLMPAADSRGQNQLCVACQNHGMQLRYGGMGALAALVGCVLPAVCLCCCNLPGPQVAYAQSWSGYAAWKKQHVAEPDPLQQYRRDLLDAYGVQDLDHPVEVQYLIRLFLCKISH